MNSGNELLSVLEAELENFQIIEYTLGRHPDNSIVLHDPRISRRHARLVTCTPTSFLLEDAGSQNGTFVNGFRITRKLVDITDTVRLADSQFTIAELLATYHKAATPIKPVKKKDPLDFTEEFAAIKLVYEQYPLLKKSYRSREKTIRTGSILLSSLIGIGAVLTSGGTLPVLQIMSGAGLGMLIPTLSSTFLSTDEKLELLEKEYRAKYRCPNTSCQDPFLGREYDRLCEQRTCKRCKAIWVH